MKSAVLHHPRQLRLENRAEPEIRPGWVLLAVEAAGICGTDVAVYEGKHPARLPIVMGHEFCGHVLAVGEDVDGLERGQFVMAEGSWTDSGVAADGPLHSAALGRTADGCFAETVAVPATAIHHLPQGVSARAAQSVTTLATAIHAVGRGGALKDRRVAVVGPGHAGLLLLQVIRAAQARTVTVLGTRDERLTVARDLGANQVVNIRSSENGGWPETEGKDQFDVVFEASGQAAGLAQGMEMVRSGGTIVCYGIINESLGMISGYTLYAKELNLFGSRGAGERYDEAIQMLAEGLIDVAPLISHVLPLEEAARAFELVIERRDGVLRVVLTP